MTKRTISLFLSVLMIVSSIYVVGIFGVVDASAAYEDKVDEDGEPIINYISQAYNTPQSKLEDMTLMREQNGYKLYMEEFTGEIAFENTKTGEILFSNPYDVSAGYNWASASTKKKLLSQLVVTYEQNGASSTMYSYEEAALRGQITSKNIKNGIRVEYTVGEIATTRLVPRMISKTRFESMILANISPEGDSAANYTRLISFYTLYDTSDTSLTERNVKEIQASFPITKQFAVYVCTPDISSKELQTLEKIIKAYCPNYTYEEMDQDHSDCDYTVSDEAPPNFKMAIEYTIDDEGLEARLPANGIRFDESNFTLTSVTLLPYMGCGSSKNTGYNFIPDGSGTLIRFEDVKDSTYNVSGQMYGADFAYHTISGQHSEKMRMPVWGIVSNIKDEDTNVEKNVGFTAIITEGDSMATLMSEHGGKLHCYNTVYASFNPRPSDKYNLADSISVGSNSSWTVTSDRKYSGSYRIKYIMLSDSSNYECSYVGMANVYRDYLSSNGIITKLENSNVKDDMPIYLETFGSIETSQKVLSFPVDVATALTTFDDVKTIYDELSEEGVSNIDFRLTGFYNGGLENTYAAKIDWVGVLGGESSFKSLIEYATEKGFGIYPEFDMAYMSNSGWFDGVNAKRDLVKSIDNRYMSRQTYDAALQDFKTDYAMAVSPSRYSYFIDKLSSKLDKYSSYGLNGLSFSTMGTDLNSDFDEDDPYNREDSKKFTTDMLEGLSSNYSLMVDGGNAYTYEYVDHIINISTESSKFLRAGESIPFTAMVLHGYISYSGSAVNMEGDVQYAILKSLENGASLYFTLCYENTSALKTSDTYNKYYSVSYDIWKDDIIKYYTELNEALGDLQTMSITDHEFLAATRTIKTDGTEMTDEEKAEQEKQEAEDQAEIERAKKRAELLKSRNQELTSSAKPSTSNRRGGGSSSVTTSVDTESGTVVRVEYENGTSFIINYNSFEINVNFNGKDYVIDALSYIRLD